MWRRYSGPAHVRYEIFLTVKGVATGHEPDMYKDVGDTKALASVQPHIRFSVALNLVGHTPP